MSEPHLPVHPADELLGQLSDWHRTTAAAFAAATHLEGRKARVSRTGPVRMLGADARLSANDEGPGSSEADKRLAAMFAGFGSNFLDLPQVLREGGAL